MNWIRSDLYESDSIIQGFNGCGYGGEVRPRSGLQSVVHNRNMEIAVTFALRL